MRNMTIVFVVLFIACLQGISSDIYAPSLPAISQFFHVKISIVQSSMAFFMIGVSLSQLIYGVLSDAFGRKIPLMIGLLIALLGSLLSYFASSIEMLIIGRLIQGCGAGATAALWRSIFRDLFKGHELVKYGSYLGIIMVFVVPAAPLLGGYLQEGFSWRASFMFMNFYTLLTLSVVFLLYKETSTHHHVDHLRFSFICKAYTALVTSRQFVIYSLCAFLVYGAFFSWFTVGPVLIIYRLGISPVTFGWFSLLGGGIAMALAGYINGRLVSRYGSTKMLKIGLLIIGLSGIILICSYMIIGLSLLGVFLPVILLLFGTTFIWPNSFAGAMMPFGHIAGYAGSFYSFMQLTGAAAIGMLVSYLPSNTPLPLATLTIAAATIVWFLVNRLPKQSDT